MLFLALLEGVEGSWWEAHSLSLLPLSPIGMQCFVVSWLSMRASRGVSRVALASRWGKASLPFLVLLYSRPLLCPSSLQRVHLQCLWLALLALVTLMVVCTSFPLSGACGQSHCSPARKPYGSLSSWQVVLPGELNSGAWYQGPKGPVTLISLQWKPASMGCSLVWLKSHFLWMTVLWVIGPSPIWPCFKYTIFDVLKDI